MLRSLFALSILLISAMAQAGGVIPFAFMPIKQRAHVEVVGGFTNDDLGNVYFTDVSAHTIRKIAPNGVVTTIAGKAGVPGFVNAAGEAARFFSPRGIVYSDHRLYVADSANNVIRVIDTTSALAGTFAGSGSGSTADGISTVASFNSPYGIAKDSMGNFFVTDTLSHTIRKVSGAGTVSTLAGSAGSPGSSNGAGGIARFNTPYGIAIDSSDVIYVADSLNHAIRQVTPTGVVTTFAGTLGVSGSNDGALNGAKFNRPTAIVTSAGNTIWVADTNNSVIRKISGAMVYTKAGAAGSQGSIDGTTGSSRLAIPNAICFDDEHDFLLVGDETLHTVRRMSPASYEIRLYLGETGVAGRDDGE